MCVGVLAGIFDDECILWQYIGFLDVVGILAIPVWGCIVWC